MDFSTALAAGFLPKDFMGVAVSPGAWALLEVALEAAAEKAQWLMPFHLAELAIFTDCA